MVELDRQEGDFRVFSIELPPDIEERLGERPLTLDLGPMLDVPVELTVEHADR